MHSGGRVQLRVRRGHHSRHSSAGREANDENPVPIGGVVIDDLFSDTCDKRWLAIAPALILRTEPIPVPHGICPSILIGIDDQEVMQIREFVHACTGCIVTHVLGPTVEHDDDRHPLAGATRRRVHQISPNAGAVRVRPLDEGTRSKTVWRGCLTRQHIGILHGQLQGLRVG
jgi:hypothetical protein